jgi:hypothetical protein
MTNVVCQDCDIEYMVKSKEAEEDGIIATFCPFCGFETTDELDFDDPVLITSDDDEDDWDNWHPDDRFN